MKIFGPIVRRLSPLLQWVYHRYSSKKRKYVKDGIELIVLPGVFNPFLFYSSRDLTNYILQNYPKGKLLELGCGSAYLSLRLASAGWTVTASDLSKIAIENAQLNVGLNKLKVEIIQSDLFEHISSFFDLIAINPPYYEGKAQTEKDLAWKSGEDHAYFRKLFFQLAGRKSKEKVLMILSDQVDIKSIVQIAQIHGFVLKAEKTISHLIENEIIYSVDPI